MNGLILTGQLNKMCKYFRNKEVEMEYEYNNSIGWHYIRKYKGKYDSFEILGDITVGYNIMFRLNGRIVFEQDINPYGWFTNVGKVMWNHSGPYCYFQIKYH